MNIEIDSDNLLVIRGDNILVLEELKDKYTGKIDLIYIDPPYGTGTTFHIDSDNVKTISKSKKDNLAYSDDLSGEDFINFVIDRVKCSYNLLSPHGTIYVHMGNLYSPYIEIELNKIFGMKNRINRICRVKCNPKNSQIKSFGNVYDTVLIYAKDKGSHIWNEVKKPYSLDDLKRLYKKHDEKGYYTTIPLHAPGETTSGATSKMWKGMLPPKGRHWRTAPDIMDIWDEQGLIEWSKNGNPRKKMYAHEKGGMKFQDIWEYKDSTTHYPTEKNSEMLSMIIKMSSNEGSIVLDYFAGSGTTGFKAIELNRKAILIDSSKEAINVIKRRHNEMD